MSANMKTIEITETLCQVEELSQMATGSGRRRENMPYYCEVEDGSMIFHLLNGDTDAAWLQNMISKGRIYARVNDISSTQT